MAVRKIRASWWVDIRSNHIRYRKRSPENSRAGAQAYEALLRHRLARGENLEHSSIAAASLLFRDFASRWLNEYVVPNNRPSEQRAKRSILSRSLIPFFGKMPIDKIGANDIERFKGSRAGKGLSSKTVNNELAVLRKCLGTAVDWRLLPSRPLLKPLKYVAPKMDYLTLQECERLLANADGQIYEMILLALKTGMRQGELRGLQWESIDWESRVIVVRHSLCDYPRILTAPKSNRERYAPLTDDLFNMLAARKQRSGYVFTDRHGRPFLGWRHLTHLQRVAETAGLRKFGWHTLRHTFASHLSMGGVPLRLVQELLGHSTIAMTMRYSHVAPSHLREAVNTLTIRSVFDAEPGQQTGNARAAV